ncbi:Ig-like domain-containing protein [Pengzhenrongella frigida]|uniref:Ig-like domain repeat protein n=1 Tax=Pengzhenrongella frigida TaxID=1259133 RepID=A0A4V1ZGW7_9MICO|nr:Ig-like domain-containing protein [Cellulomonas sp. HLT2-17]RYV49984.1 Ig-like domain repeat protein [Cellulomonas sp. HLT2-17]
MRLTKSLAAVAASSLLLTGLAVATAGSASAADDGPLLPGNIYLFNSKTVSLNNATNANIVTSGTNLTRPWSTIAVDQVCPAGTTQNFTRVRIPQVGVNPISWDEVQFNATSTELDALGRSYNSTNSNPMTSAKVAAYVLAQGGTATLPLAFVCADPMAVATGYFESTLTVVGNTSAGTWSVPTPPALTASGVVATATTLSAVGSGANLVLTATVAPSAAGTVIFREGTTDLGSVAVAAGSASYTVTAPSIGNHTFTASFVPTDPAAFGASDSASQTFTVGAAPVGTSNITVTLLVPAAPVVTSGSLTISAPAAPTVALTGARDSGNTRVTATAALPSLTVSDTRSDDILTSWQVNVQASDFTSTGGTVGAKYLGWTPSSTKTPDAGSPLNVQSGPEVLSFLDSGTSAGLGASQLLGKSTVSGRGTSALGAALNLAIPPTTAEGSYTSTITVTLIGG